MVIKNPLVLVKPRRRRFAFSVRGLLLFNLVIGFWLGWGVYRARQQREAVAALTDFGGSVHYDYEFIYPPFKPSSRNLLDTTWGRWEPEGKKPWAPDWLRRPLGDEYFQEVALIRLDARRGVPNKIGPDDELLAKLSSQKGVRTLRGRGPTVSGMSYIGQMDGLEELNFFNGEDITDEGIAHLRTLKHLRILKLSNSRMTDEGLHHLANFTDYGRIDHPRGSIHQSGLVVAAWDVPALGALAWGRSS